MVIPGLVQRSDGFEPAYVRPTVSPTPGSPVSPLFPRVSFILTGAGCLQSRLLRDSWSVSTRRELSLYQTDPFRSLVSVTPSVSEVGQLVQSQGSRRSSLLRRE